MMYVLEAATGKFSACGIYRDVGVMLGAQARPDRAELKANHAAADHDHGLRHRRQDQRTGRGDDALLVDVEALQPGHVRAGRDDDMLGRGHGLGAV